VPRIHRRIVVGIIALLAIVASFVAGANFGIQLGVMLDGPPRGALALHHLAAIEAGRTNNTRVALEGDVDMGLVWGYQLQEEPLRSFLEHFTFYPLSIHDDYLNRLANHRLKTPSPLRAEALEREPAPQEEDKLAAREYLLEGARADDAIIAEMVKRYASIAEKKL